MIISRDLDKEQDILTKVTNHIHGDTNREYIKNVHVSDLLWCLRQSFYKKTNPTVLSMSEVLKFFKGKVSEYAIGRFIFQEEHYLQQEKIRGENGIVAHPDIISHKDNIVIELKLTDKLSFVDPRDTMYNSFIYYTTQLLYYLYLSGKRNGSIIVNHANYNMFAKKYDLTDNDKNPFRIFSIELEDSDIPIIKADLDFKKSLLETALAEDKVGYLPKLVTIDINNTAKCNRCQFKSICKSDKDYWQNNIINKIISIKKGDITEYMESDFIEFIKKFGNQNVETTNVDYLYNIISKQFNLLGEYYK